MKKILALTLVLIMALSLATTAFAAEGDTYSITILKPENGTLDNHVYKVYQIFTGDLATGEDGKLILSNVKYGQNYGTKGAVVPETELEALDAMTGEAAAKKLDKDKTGEAYATLNKDNNWKVTTVPAGYYLIVDVSTGLAEGETSSAFILQLVDNVEINSKHSNVPNVQKKIKDTNDSVADSTTDWQDSADHDIGDDIPFQLKMTVPAIFEQFKIYGEAYRFVFHDTEEQGLSFNNDAKVYVNGKQITSGFEVVFPTAHEEDDDTFDVVFADLTQIPDLKANDVITVEYTSKLTQSAVLGKPGNVNTVYGEYSNLHRPEYPGFTPKDTVIAFTYKVVVNKVDENKAPLAGAEFTLEKYDVATDSWKPISKVETEAGTTFTFNGLDDGNYRLTETDTPPGYNSIKPIEFTVTADHDILWETQDRLEVLNSLTGDVTTGEIQFTATEDKDTLSSDVVNKSGTVLPETGGMGTTIFYIVGGLLAVAAVVLLITKKRMNSAE